MTPVAPPPSLRRVTPICPRHCVPIRPVAVSCVRLPGLASSESLFHSGLTVLLQSWLTTKLDSIR
jgi:hypothetical protein